MGSNVRRRDGFILIIVIGLLGVLAALAVNLARSGSLQSSLSAGGLGRTQVKLLARSGIELGMLRTRSRLAAAELDWRSETLTFSLDAARRGSDTTEVRLQDTSGCLALNDGVAAGRLELGDAYEADKIALNMTGDTPDQMTSAWINVRLRRLLNAYGEAHRFVAEMGWPVARYWDFIADPGNFGSTSPQFTPFLEDAAGDHTSAQPARDKDGNNLPEGAETVKKARLLGDRILSNRPASGYNKVEEVRELVDSWAADILPAGYVTGGSFFDMIRTDLAVHVPEDASFFRMKREIGTYRFDHDFSRIPVRTRLDEDVADIDLADLWAPHSVATVNMNGASDFVRAAVYYAPAHVRLVCEGIEGLIIDDEEHDTVQPRLRHASARPWLGVGSMFFRSQDDDENGRPVANGTRFMSLRDALVRAQVDRIVNDDHDRWDADIFEFRDRIYWERSANTVTGDPAPIGTALEKVHPATEAQQVSLAHFPFRKYKAPNKAFDHDYFPKILPDSLSPVRRVPGWLGAPLALLSPYYQHQLTNKILSDNYDGDDPLRSSEDFVLRSHLPKIRFTPAGVFRLSASARIDESTNVVFRAALSCTVRLAEETVLRTQKQFHDRIESTGGSWPSSHGLIHTGPEPEGGSVDPSPWLGHIGLKDTFRLPRDPADPTHVFAAAAVLSFDDSVGAFALPTASKFLDRRVPADEAAYLGTGSGLTETSPPGYGGYPDIRTEVSLTYPATATTVSQIMKVFRDFRELDPPEGETWRVPVDPYLILIQTLPDYSGIVTIEDLDEAGLRAKFENPANHPSAFPGGYPGDGHPLEVLLWYSTVQGSTAAGGTVAHMLWNRGDGTGPGAFLGWCRTFGVMSEEDYWRAGDPGTGDRQDHTPLIGSDLEGNTVSRFETGAAASDLSSFGGVHFGSLGHGQHSGFTDSLYFRPQNLLEDDDRVEDLYSKGFISLWFQTPAGFQNHNTNASLWHMTLQRYMAQHPVDPDGTAAVFMQYFPFTKRMPVLETTEFSINFSPEVSTYDQSMTTPKISYSHSLGRIWSRMTDPYLISVPKLPDDHDIGFMDVTQPTHDSLNLVNRFENASRYYGGWIQENNDVTTEGGRLFLPMGPETATRDDVLRPGTWNRLVMGWDLTSLVPEEQRIWARLVTSTGAVNLRFRGTGHQPADLPVHGDFTRRNWASRDFVGAAPESRTDRAVITLGERPYWLTSGLYFTNTITQETNTFRYRDSPPLIPVGGAGLIPLARFNSAIDNVFMGFGSTGPFANQAELDAGTRDGGGSPLYDPGNDYFTIRYDLEESPCLVLDPGFADGTVLLRVTAAIYDVPNLGNNLNSPIVTLDAVSTADGVIPEAASAPARAFRSPGWKSYASEITGTDTRLVVGYNRDDFDGNDFQGRAYNIPWVEEIAWMVGTTPKILDWSSSD